MRAPEQVQRLGKAQSVHVQGLARGGRGIVVSAAVHDHREEAIEDTGVLVHAAAVVVGGAAVLVGVGVARLVPALRHVHVSKTSVTVLGSGGHVLAHGPASARVLAGRHAELVVQGLMTSGGVHGTQAVGVGGVHIEDVNGLAEDIGEGFIHGARLRTVDQAVASLRVAMGPLVAHHVVRDIPRAEVDAPIAIEVCVGNGQVVLNVEVGVGLVPRDVLAIRQRVVHVLHVQAVVDQQVHLPVGGGVRV
mmetsp:Transcript_25457/g.42908  ORF Transcript_25457/g.42908 Transcript_25457/m.42908 type:complete len:248 (-) Transcript_25457:977-1720(-)